LLGPYCLLDVFACQAVLAGAFSTAWWTFLTVRRYLLVLSVLPVGLFFRRGGTRLHFQYCLLAIYACQAVLAAIFSTACWRVLPA
ncbi:MAG: hypothetical protein J6W66_00945, partial [Lachnospiraceae bacterium]|nr:hypothetical protein [Lachnospiraceae bacterium]